MAIHDNLGGYIDDFTGTTVDVGSVTSDSNYVYIAPKQEGKYDETSKIRAAKTNINLRTYKTVTKTFNVTPQNGYLIFDFSGSLTEVVGIVKCYDVNHRVGGVQLIDIQGTKVRLYTTSTSTYSSVPMTVIGY